MPEVSEAFVFLSDDQVFLQTFRDIAAAANDPAAPEPDLMDITPITTPRLRSLRWIHQKRDCKKVQFKKAGKIKDL